METASNIMSWFICLFVIPVYAFLFLYVIVQYFSRR